MTKSEQIALALLAAIGANLPPGAEVKRNETVPQRIARGGLIMLHDGEPGEPEVYLSPLAYAFQHRFEADVMIDLPQASERDGALDALKVAIGAAIAADRTLVGLCDYVEAEAPQTLELPIEPSAALKAANIGIVCSYTTPDPLS